MHVVVHTYMRKLLTIGGPTQVNFHRRRISTAVHILLVHINMQVNVCVGAPLTEGISKWELIANIPNHVDTAVPPDAY